MKNILATICLALFLGLISSAAQTPSAIDTETELLNRINDLRISLTLQSLRLHPALIDSAQNHANWMVDTGEVTHIQPDGSRPSDRATLAGYPSSWVSENIYMGLLANEDYAWDFWLNSDIHYAGITSPQYQHIGIASATGAGGTAFVLVFGNSGTTDDILLEVTEQTTQAFMPEVTEELEIIATLEPTATPMTVRPSEDGIIRYEIQAGDTLSDVVVSFGYTWDILPLVLELNNMTWGDVRYLHIGDIILIPEPDIVSDDMLAATPFVQFGIAPTPSANMPDPVFYAPTATP